MHTNKNLKIQKSESLPLPATDTFVEVEADGGGFGGGVGGGSVTLPTTGQSAVTLKGRVGGGSLRVAPEQEMPLTSTYRPELPSGEAPGKRTTEDSTTRSLRDRAEAAEFVQSTIEQTKVPLYSIAAIHAPIFNPESLKTKDFFNTMHRFEKEMDVFAAAILGKSKMTG